MANKYARTVGGNWDTDATWSTTSGGAADTVKPTASDDVFLDANSGAVTINAVATCKSITCTGYTSTLTHQSVQLSVAGNILFVAGMTYTPNASTNCVIAITAACTFTSAGKNIPNITLSNALTLGDNMTLYNVKASAITLNTGGSINLGGNTLAGFSSTSRILLQSGSVGTARTVTVASGTFANADFQDIQFSSASDVDLSAITGGSGDCGGNSITGGGTVLTFSTSVPQYYGGVNLNGSYLRCNSISGNYCYSLDSVPLSIVADIELQARVSFDDWTPGAERAIIAKRLSTGNQRSMLFTMTAGDRLAFIISPDGTSGALQTATASAATGFTDGTVHWLKVTYVKSTGVVQFFTADDNASVPSSWTQLGTDISTIAADTAIQDGTSPLEVGSYDTGLSGRLIGNFYRARVLNGVGGTVVFDADFTAQSAGTKSFTESSSNGATVSLVVTGGNWSASAWTTRVPLPQDDAYLGNAFTASQTVTADMPRLGRSIDWTGATGSPTFSGSISQTSYGSYTLITAMTHNQTGGYVLAGRGNYRINMSGKSFGGTLVINAPTGRYDLDSALTTADNFTANTDFYTNGYSMTTLTLLSTGALTRTINMTSTLWTLTGTSGTPLNLGGSNLTLTTDNSTFAIGTTSTSQRTIAGAGKTFGTLTYTVAGSTGKLTITGSNSFSQINFSDASNARTLEFTAGTTTTIRSGNGFNVQGTALKLMTVTSATAAQHTLSSTSKQVCSYLNVVQSAATGGGAWYAQTTSTDGGSNSGWIFTDAPASVSQQSNAGVGSVRNLQNIQRL